MKQPTNLELALCEQLPWGIKVQHLGKNFTVRALVNGVGTKHEKGVLLEGCSDSNVIPFHCLSPIFFDLSCLTKEITISYYNDGEPFVPIVDLAKLLVGKIYGAQIIENGIRFCKLINDEDCVITFYDNGFRIKLWSYDEEEFEPDLNIQKVIDFLNMLHFNTRNLEPHEFINALEHKVY